MSQPIASAKKPTRDGWKASFLPSPDWRADLTAGFLVFLIALPLSLGIAMASGFPPVAGVLTAMVGGVLATFFGSAPLTIKGPAAGLIVIALGAVQELGAGDAATGYKRALATIVVAGLLQVVLGLARAGTLGDAFPGAAVHGMLAAIGVIIVSKQSHTLLGVKPMAKEPLELLAEIPHSLTHANAEIALIGVVSIATLLMWPLLSGRWFKAIPPQLIVLGVAIPLGLVFDLDHSHTFTWGGLHGQVGPDYLVNLPGNLLSALAWPDFSVVTSATSVKYIAMFALVGSIESLLSAKAVDALDPARRESNLSRDLLATGLGNVVAGLIGGLPMISEIVRSSANITAGARSQWANFFHGLLLLAFVVAVPGLLHRIPLAALGAMLVYTGVRLASPGELVKAWRVGREQFAVFVTTMLVTLATDLLVGVAAGIVLELVLHLLGGAPMRGILRAGVEYELDGDRHVLRVVPSALFSNFISLKAQLQALDHAVPTVVLDLSQTRYVDHTTLHGLHQLQRRFADSGRTLLICGLDEHNPVSDHAHASRKKDASIG